MNQSLLLGLSLPVTLAFGALLLVSLVVARVVASLRKPAVVRQAEPSFGGLGFDGCPLGAQSASDEQRHG